MRSRLSWVVCLAVTPWALGGCGNSTSPSNMPEADVVTPGQDAAVHEDAGPSCGDVGGVYLAQGECSSDAYYFPPILCVRQTGCDASLVTSGGQRYTGTVSDGRVEVHATVPIPQVCSAAPTSSGDGLDVVCEAEALGISCSAQAVHVERADVEDPCCDPMAQDCSDPTRRCTLIGVEGDPGFASGCIADDGTLTKGAPCTRRASGAAGLGRDDCQKGLFCTALGAVDPEDLRCLMLCDDNDQCGADEACRRVNGAPNAGLCAPSCSLWADGDACAAGTTCRPASSLESAEERWAAFCVPLGEKVLGDACTYHDDCVAGAICGSGADGLRCRPLCDDEHPCAQGSCSRLTGAKVESLGASTGFCL